MVAMHVGNHFLISVGGMRDGAALQSEIDYIYCISLHTTCIHYLPQ